MNSQFKTLIYVTSIGILAPTFLWFHYRPEVVVEVDDLGALIVTPAAPTSITPAVGPKNSTAPLNTSRPSIPDADNHLSPTNSINYSAIEPLSTPAQTPQITNTIVPVSPTSAPSSNNTPTPTIQATNTPSPANVPSATSSPVISLTPTDLELIQITSPVKQKDKAIIALKTRPSAQCQITLTLPSGTVSTSKDLAPKTAGADGNLSWTWSINWNTKPGTASVSIVCSAIDFNAQIQTTLEIIPSS